jgi:UDP-2,4-diacetamido-2,4,6-trideoxy-beta-L-altropyranose hydrolase
VPRRLQALELDLAVNVVFRVDASYRIGSGHISRCLSLAKVLADHGVRSSFLCRHMPDALVARIRSRAHELIRLPNVQVRGANQETDMYADGVEPAQEEDAQQTKDALRGRRCDWVIVDHYSLDFRWENAVREIASTIMAIDDLADRRHDCDLLLDQNYFADLHSRYEGLLPAEACRLLGPRYALLDPQFAAARVNSVRAQVERLFVSVGANDPFRICMKAVISLHRFAPPFLGAEIVAGSDTAAGNDAQSSAHGLHNVAVHGYIDDIARVMARCTLAVGAGGSSTWERCAIGIPSIVIITADNQRQMAMDLAQTGVIVLLGEGKDVSAEEIYGALAELRSDAVRLSRMRRDAMDLVDGEGAYRVTRRMLEMARCTN